MVLMLLHECAILHKRVEEVEKKSIDCFLLEVHQQRSRLGTSIAISLRTRQQLIRHATTTRYQRRKSRIIVVRKIGCTAFSSATNSLSERAGYGRYPSVYKPSLSPEYKFQRLNNTRPPEEENFQFSISPSISFEFCRYSKVYFKFRSHALTRYCGIPNLVRTCWSND